MFINNSHLKKVFFSIHKNVEKEAVRIECVICKQRDENLPSVKCVKSNVGYESQCARCPIKFSYVGEMSRTAYHRIFKHLTDYRAAHAAKLPALPDDGGVRVLRKANVKSLCGSTAVTFTREMLEKRGVCWTTNLE